MLITSRSSLLGMPANKEEEEEKSATTRLSYSKTRFRAHQSTQCHFGQASRLDPRQQSLSGLLSFFPAPPLCVESSRFFQHSNAVMWKGGSCPCARGCQCCRSVQQSNGLSLSVSQIGNTIGLDVVTLPNSSFRVSGGFILLLWCFCVLCQ